ncbi:hypothetical protein ACRRTK_008799 [Alexandromys fortis]
MFLCMCPLSLPLPLGLCVSLDWQFREAKRLQTPAKTITCLPYKRKIREKDLLVSTGVEGAAAEGTCSRCLSLRRREKGSIKYKDCYQLDRGSYSC